MKKALLEQSATRKEPQMQDCNAKREHKRCQHHKLVVYNAWNGPDWREQLSPIEHVMLYLAHGRRVDKLELTPLKVSMRAE